jgi:hypothetical protein
MKRLLLIAGMLLCTGTASAQSFDPHWGLTTYPCTNATGHFIVEKSGSQWLICTPESHRYWFQGVFYMQPGANLRGSTANWAAAATYRLKAWNFNGIHVNSADYVLPPLGAPPTSFPFFVSVKVGLASVNHAGIPVAGGKTYRPLTYNVKNICMYLPSYFNGWCPIVPDIADTGIASLAHFVFTQDTGHVLNYTSSSYLLGITTDDADQFFPFGGGDQCDINGKNCLYSNPNTSLAYLTMTSSPTGTGGCQGTYLGCPNAQNADWVVNFDVELKSKTKAMDSLKAKYGTIGALNAAWGSTYTACNLGRTSPDGFGSCGTQISAETMATADGRTGTYPNHTLSSMVPSRNSVQIKVNGTSVAGDVRVDNAATVEHFFGAYIAGQITYSTGVIANLQFFTTPTASQSRGIETISTNGSTVTAKTIAQHGLWTGAKVTVSGTTNYNIAAASITVLNEYQFTYAKAGAAATENNVGSYVSTQVPQGGDTITVAYIQNGYAIGNGILDEDGRSSHTWIAPGGNVSLNVTTNLSTTIINDFDLIDHDIANVYLSGVGTQYRADLPNLLFVGIDGVSTYGHPARRGILKAMGENVDFLQVAYGLNFTQAALDYVHGTASESYGDHPILGTFYPVVTADAPGSGNCFTGGGALAPTYTNHTLLGAAYYGQMNSILNLHYTNGGSFPYLGMGYWSYVDKPGADGCGVVSQKDNSYNGVEDVTATVPCLAPLNGSPVGPYNCGGETANFTNSILGSGTGIQAANALWQSISPPSGNAILTVNSNNPNNGVAITVSPPDLNSQSNGTTSFVRTYNINTTVTLVAPATAGGNNFVGWTGCTTPSGQTCSKTLTINAIVTANYQPPAPVVRTITVNSTNPVSGVVIATSPADNNSNVSVTTSGTLLYNDATSYNLTAPATAGSNTFANWTNCTTPASNVCHDVATANKTITANYIFVPPTRILIVTSVNPVGTSFTVAPVCNGASPVTSPANCTFTTGTVVVVNAPATSNSNNFSGWAGCDSVGGTGNRDCTVAVNGNQTITATYVTPPVVRTITVNSTTPNSAVVVANSPADNGSNVTVTTPGTLLYNNGTGYTLTAPMTAGGNTFNTWTNCASAVANVCTETATADKTITANYLVTPVTFTLSVASVLPVGTSIIASPVCNGSSPVTTPIGCVYNQSTAVALTAPATSGGNTFDHWTGCDSVSGTGNRDCNVTVNSNRSVTVTYAAPPPPTGVLTVNSTNPGSGVVIAISPNDVNGFGAGTTGSLTRTYTIPTTVTLIAPATATGNPFLNWTGCDSVVTVTCTISVTGNKTVTATYGYTLTITSNNPTSGVALVISPPDNTGASNGSTPLTRIYAPNIQANVTAPLTSGTSNFSSWTGCDSTTANICNIIMNGNKTITANYVQNPGTFTCSRITGIVIVSGKMKVSCTP